MVAGSTRTEEEFHSGSSRAGGGKARPRGLDRYPAASSHLVRKDSRASSIGHSHLEFRQFARQSVISISPLFPIPVPGRALSKFSLWKFRAPVSLLASQVLSAIDEVRGRFSVSRRCTGFRWGLISPSMHGHMDCALSPRKRGRLYSARSAEWALSIVENRLAPCMLLAPRRPTGAVIFSATF